MGHHLSAFGTEGDEPLLVISDRHDYAERLWKLVSTFPSIWILAHPGRGMPSALLYAESVPQEAFNNHARTGFPGLNVVLRGADQLQDRSCPPHRQADLGAG